MSNDNLKILELCYRRVDIRDAADGCVAAMQKAPEIGWGRYVISAPTPFQRNQETLERLNSNASDVLKEVLPGCAVLFEQKNWKFLGEIDRVYDSTKAQKELGWKPKITIQTALEKVGRGEEWRSELATTVGRRGYHAVSTAFYTSR
jgi:nucleoside-diphosphate-sugar epimerase